MRKNMAVETLDGFKRYTQYFLIAGKGDGEWEEVALDQARVVAGLGEVRRLRLSSIVPPGCRRAGRLRLQPHSSVGVAYARMVCSEPGRQIASAVAVAHPTDRTRASLVMEYSGFAGQQEAKETVIQMAVAGLLYRGLQVRRVESIAIDNVVGDTGAAATFAAVVEF